MAIIIGSARSDENKQYAGGRGGDQRQSSSPDNKGEVSLQAFYKHKKGWYILRPKNEIHAEGIAQKMLEACNNACIGYSQSDRYGIIKYGISTKQPTNCDCSSLIRECIKEATGKDVGDFNTSSEASVLEKSGLFEKRIPYKNGTPLYRGDVLVTQSKGHTVAVVTGDVKKEYYYEKGVWEVVQEVINGKWGNGAERKRRLTEAGYDYKDIQNKVNERLKG